MSAQRLLAVSDNVSSDLQNSTSLCWSWTWARFNVPPNIGHIGEGFSGSNDPTNNVKALKEDTVLRIRLQSHQVHPTVLTIIQRIGLCSMKQKHTKYTQITTNSRQTSQL